MLLAILGGIGFGLIWGWLLGSLGGRIRRPMYTGLALIGATSISAGITFWFAGRDILGFFLGATASAFALHLCWRWHLYDRFGSLK